MLALCSTRFFRLLKLALFPEEIVFRKILLLPIMLGAGILAQADVLVPIPDRATQNPTDIIDWTQLGVDGTDLTTPQLVSTFAGNLALVGNFFGGDFLRVDNSFSWPGNFDYGEPLVWTAGAGPFVLEFANPVTSFGFNIQAALYGAFNATVDVFDSSLNFSGSLTLPGISTGNPDGSALFLGLNDLSGPNIGAIVISTDSNDFAINDPSFTYSPAAIPEPASTAMVGAALVAAGLLGRTLRRAKKL
jgi:hypothetical protein